MILREAIMPLCLLAMKLIRMIKVIFSSLLKCGFSMLAIASIFACTHSPRSIAQNSTYHAASEQSFAEDSLTRTGEITVKELLTRYPKFRQSYDNFEPDSNDIKNFSLLNNMEAVIFFGLWCHDSQREIPRLIKIMQQSDTEFKSFKLIAINTSKEVEAQYAEKFEVNFTPTIFILKNNQILATMVEKPSTTITQELLSQILH